jgi:hypothetical protein
LVQSMTMLVMRASAPGVATRVLAAANAARIAT